MHIIWDDKLKTGISRIDEQHKAIIAMLSEIHISKLSKAVTLQLLSELQDILVVHFETEEEYMINAKYPEYQSHKANHDKVLQDYENILTQNKADDSPSEMATKMIKYIKSWFVGHYSNEDVKMAGYLKKNAGNID